MQALLRYRIFEKESVSESMISQFRERIVGMHYLNQWIVLILDTVASVLCTFLACILAGHLVPGTMGMSAVLKITLLAVPASGLSFYLFRIYRNIIRHSTLRGVVASGRRLRRETAP